FPGELYRPMPAPMAALTPFACWYIGISAPTCETTCRVAEERFWIGTSVMAPFRWISERTAHYSAISTQLPTGRSWWQTLKRANEPNCSRAPDRLDRTFGRLEFGRARLTRARN